MVESFCLEGRAEDFMKFYRIGRYQSIFIDRNCGEGPTTSGVKGRKIVVQTQGFLVLVQGSDV